MLIVPALNCLSSVEWRTKNVNDGMCVDIAKTIFIREKSFKGKTMKGTRKTASRRHSIECCCHCMALPKLNWDASQQLPSPVDILRRQRACICTTWNWLKQLLWKHWTLIYRTLLCSKVFFTWQKYPDDGHLGLRVFVCFLVWKLGITKSSYSKGMLGDRGIYYIGARA